MAVGTHIVTCTEWVTQLRSENDGYLPTLLCSHRDHLRSPLLLLVLWVASTPSANGEGKQKTIRRSSQAQEAHSPTLDNGSSSSIHTRRTQVVADQSGLKGHGSFEETTRLHSFRD